MDTHFAIPVKNLGESKSFYEKLGFEVFAQWEKPDQNLKAIKMKNESGCSIELVYHPDSNNFSFPKVIEILHIGLGVKNLAARLGELKKDGIDPDVPITEGVSVKQFAFIRDPNGFPIELFEY